METDSNHCNYTYNWDEIDMGDYNANTSEFFFMEKHPKHERLSEDKEQIQPKLNDKIADSNKDMPTTVNGVVEKVNNLKVGAKPRTPLKTKPVIANKQTVPAAFRANAQPKPSAQPKVYEFTKIYDEKKKQRLEKLQEKEKQQRQFHSHPAPNFRAIHAAAQRKKQQIPLPITCPSTPAVVKRHKEKQEQIKKLREEHEKNQRPKPFVSNSDPEVLRKKPFVPQIKEKQPIIPEPFNLQSSARMKDRKQFDDITKSEAERKRLEQEELERQEEERVRKEIRKQTEFKAQPNPFK